MLIFIEMRDKIKKHLFCFNLVILKKSKFLNDNKFKKTALEDLLDFPHFEIFVHFYSDYLQGLEEIYFEFERFLHRISRILSLNL